MADVSGTVLRGLLVGDERLNYADGWSSTSVLTQQGPVPGSPAPLQETEMVLEAYGTQAAATTLHVQAISAGHPSPESGGTFAWRYLPGDDWTGWDGPQNIVGWEAIDYTTTANRWRHPHALRRIDGGISCVVWKESRYIRHFSRAHDGLTWTETGIADLGATYTYSGAPTVLQLPSGRLLCFYWWELSATSYQVYMSYSDDDGASWTRGQKGCLEEAINPVDYEPKRIRAAYLNGNIVLVAHVVDTTPAAANSDRDRLFQYASVDLGASFTLVSQTAAYLAGGDLVSRACPDVVATREGEIIVAYLKERAASPTITVHYVRLGSATQPMATSIEYVMEDSSSLGAVTGGLFSADELALWQDEDGMLYVMALVDGAGVGRILQSKNGRDWTTLPRVPRSFWRGEDDANVHPLHVAACSQGGRTVMIHRFTSVVDNHGGSLCAMYLGGYTTLTAPTLPGYTPSFENRVNPLVHWLPYDEPEDYAAGAVWTKTVGGGATVSLTGGGLRILGATAGDGINYTKTNADTDLGVGMLVEASSDRTSSNHATRGRAYVEVQNGDNAGEAYGVAVRWNDQEVHVIDLAAAADIGTFTDADLLAAVTDGITFRVSMTQDAVRVWWARTAGHPAHREWTELTLVPATLTNYGINLVKEIRWGAEVVTSNQTVSTTWYHVAMSPTQGTAGENLVDFTGVPELCGRFFSSTPEYVDAGLLLKAVDGPAFFADKWDIPTAYRYGIENVHPEVSPSPRREWRSVNDDVQVDLIWEYDSVLDQRSLPLNGSLGLYLGNINFRTASFWGYDGAVWTQIGSILTTTGQASLSFLRRGDLVLPDSAPGGTSAQSYYTHNILAGSYVMMVGGEQGGTVVRKIVHNSEGAWRRDNGTTKVTRLTLEGVLAADPLGGGAQTLDIMSKDVLLVMNATDRYSRYKLTIAPQVTYEGYFKIGVRVLGPVFYFGRQYSFGRVLGAEHNSEISQSRGGTRRVRVNGPQRRSVQLGWIDMVDTSPLAVATPTPDFQTAYTGSTDPVAVPADTPWTVAGVSEYLQGPAEHLVYCPTVERQANAADDYQCLTRNNMVYGRMVTGVSLEAALGNEWSSPSGEAFRVASVTIEEDV